MPLPPARRLRLLLPWLAVAAAIALASGLAAREARQRSLAASATQAREQLRAHGDALQAVIERYRTLPAVLALDPEVRQALADAGDGTPVGPAATAALNRKLEAVNGAAATSTLTLLDGRGRSIAASNWRLAQSNVGVDYGFRPYFQQAMADGDGAFYALGVTTGRPGYFLSQAVRDAGGRAIGVVVVKLAFDDVEAGWRRQPDAVLVSDRHDIVFLSGRDAWRYRDLRPLRAHERAELARSRQYGAVPSRPLRRQRLEQVAPDVRLVRLDARDAGAGVERLWASRPLRRQGWTVHLASAAAPRAAADAARTMAATVAATLSLAALSLLLVQQRRRLARLRERSRVELEQLVERHAIELRTAQDGLVQAAGRADYGESPSLQHLPQGVCVIDRELRLVAWNRRYIELFRFPAGLIEVGRPIEDVFAHNARRGLLGPGPVEEAIARRIGHLRSGKPHMHERERADGTVIEIRGNPLPDGGFVTSYADITSYKDAARELRSLADALERRIQERTRDLDQARREAERANQSKTRFVAAAVHDLLQPLNAARMFVSALHGRLQGQPQARELAEHVEGALGAQESILASLLDIARLESGALETRIETFALEPLLDALGREFGMLARAQGVALSRVPTRAVVRSDRALLRRIVQNFLSNAVRYTPRGRIVLGCRRDGAGLRIEVHDTGPGIPAALQREIFEEFRRLDRGTAGDRGAGLGLAIVERIARLLGHAIGLRSEPGRGSVFSVRLPLASAAQARDARARDAAGDDVAAARATAAPATAEDDPRLAGCVVWCVDDDPRVCEASRALLTRWGCRVPVAAGPAQALAAAVPGGAPRLLLLDMRLGDTTGRALYRDLLQRWAPGARDGIGIDADGATAAGDMDEPDATHDAHDADGAGDAQAGNDADGTAGDGDAGARVAVPRCEVILVTAERDEATRALARRHGWGYLPKPVRPAALRALMMQRLLRGG